MKKLILSILFFTLCNLSLIAQSSQKFDVLFVVKAPSENALTSKVYEVKDIPSNIPFIGISAYQINGREQADLKYRVKRNNEWSEWTGFKVLNEAILEDRIAYEALPQFEVFTHIQFASDKISGDKPFTFRLYFPYTQKKNTKQKHSLNKVANCSCAQPAYCDRNCWCPQGNCPPPASYSTTTPTHIIVHHSAGFNTSNDFAAVVAYYWDLHVNTNGWDDLGYNWLVDPNGVVYEGRGSGNRGAHFSCMNGNTMGICMIGNFEDQMPTDTSIIVLKEMLAWEACDKNIVPNINSYHSSSQLTLEHISGHRDGNPATVGCPKGTVCPGDSLYDMLGSIRAELATFPCLQGVDLHQWESGYFDIYPNPAQKSLKILLDKSINPNTALLTVYNMKGEVIRNFKTGDYNLTSGQWNISLEGISPGAYQLNLTVDHNIYSKLLTIK